MNEEDIVLSFEGKNNADTIGVNFMQKFIFNIAILISGIA
jgi:hypothetical protein